MAAFARLPFSKKVTIGKEISFATIKTFSQGPEFPTSCHQNLKGIDIAIYLVAAINSLKKKPTHPLFLWLHNEAARVEIIKFNRLYFKPGTGQLLTLSILFKPLQYQPPQKRLRNEIPKQPFLHPEGREDYFRGTHTRRFVKTCRLPLHKSFAFLLPCIDYSTG